MPSLNVCVPASKKLSGEQSRISCAYCKEVVRTNEIAGVLVVTQHFPYNSKLLISTQASVSYLSGFDTRLH